MEPLPDGKTICLQNIQAVQGVVHYFHLFLTVHCKTFLIHTAPQGNQPLIINTDYWQTKYNSGEKKLLINEYDHGLRKINVLYVF